MLPSLSDLSSPATAQSLWHSSDFLLGAGAVIIQPSTQRVCIIEDSDHCPGAYFLPRGRKDVGESLEQTALREGFEESGYQVEFLPAVHWVRQPRAPGAVFATKQDWLTTEAFYIAQRPFFDRPRRNVAPPTGGEHIVFWYLCQLPPDATPEQGTRMPDEQGFVTHLLPFDEAIAKMRSDGSPTESVILEEGITIWQETTKFLAQHLPA